MRVNPIGPRIPRGTAPRNKDWYHIRGFRECLVIMRRVVEYANIVRAYGVEESISGALDRLRHDLIWERYI
ncbi:hypothetical protein ALC60_08120 [Trachymyrmex zeteki]|uniref:Uncharacterized protein n=1 Tax=Mycetomoellerius zeteki TaxID=64791 RepID=A0A151WYD7_9HYME|nr:hypothetical protein ALC60_08120 [Trachymyrmex zeteki]